MAVVKVSVVVPVFDPGSSIDRCIESLLAQSLPRDEFEVLFVDDGSTDDTPARLDRLAEQYPNVRVIHTPNSGWPGRPRNIGVQHATGEYVQFLDQDDHLAPEALARLYDMGQRNGADIVIGKVASDFRSVPAAVFRRDVDVCTIYDAPLIDTLTPHKMFRRAMLIDRGIAFPEGRRRLEDQLFMVRAYFAAHVVSILASYTCYFYLRRVDGRNAGSAIAEPSAYFGDLREVIDVVLANTAPGDRRARLLRRFCRTEMLGRLSEPRYLVRTPDYRRSIYAAIRPLYVDVADEQVEAGLEAITRLRGRLVREDRPDDVLELATRLSRLQAVCQVARARWTAGRFEVDFSVAIQSEDGSVLAVSRRDGITAFDAQLTDGLVDGPLVLTSEDLAAVRLGATLRDRTTAVEWRVPLRLNAPPWIDGSDDNAAKSDIRMRASAILDPARLGGGGPLGPGEWDVTLRLRALGLDRRTPLGGSWSAAAERESQPRVVGMPPMSIVPTIGPDGGLSLAVQAVSPGEARRLRRRRGRLRGLADRLVGLPRAIYRGLPSPVRAPVSAVYRFARRHVSGIGRP